MINQCLLLHYSSIRVPLTAAYSTFSETHHWFLFPSTRVETLVLAPKSQTVNLMDKTDALFFNGRGSVRSAWNPMTSGVASRRRLRSERTCVNAPAQVTLLKFARTCERMGVVSVYLIPDKHDLLVSSLV